jgi:hypothetical protein
MVADRLRSGACRKMYDLTKAWKYVKYHRLYAISGRQVMASCPHCYVGSVRALLPRSGTECTLVGVKIRVLPRNKQRRFSNHLYTKYQEDIDVGQTEGLVTIKSRFIPYWEVLVVPYRGVLIVSGRPSVDGSRCGG